MAGFLCCCKGAFYTQRGLSLHRAKCSYSPPKSLGITLAAAFRKKRLNNGPFKSPQRRSVTVPQGIDPDADPSPPTIVEPPPVPGPRPEGSGSRSGSIRTVPSRYKHSPAQLVPLALAHTPQPAAHRQTEQPPDGSTPPTPPADVGPVPFKTDSNEVRVDRVYSAKPSTDPDTIVGLEHVRECP